MAQNQEQGEVHNQLADNFIEPLTEGAISELRDMFGIAGTGNRFHEVLATYAYE